MKESFFSRIRSYFKADNDGRYLSYILAEIARQHPAQIAEVLANAFALGKRQLARPILEPEYCYDGSHRADLAVRDSADAEPFALIEIKYYDTFLPGQLDSYRAWSKRGANRRVLVLSRETMMLEGVSTLTWTQLARLLKKVRQSSDLARALIAHLEEEGIVMQAVKAGALTAFLDRLMCPWNGAGIQAGNVDGPQEFSKLMRNMQLLSSLFNPHFKAAWNLSGEKHEQVSGTKDASIDFNVVHRLKENKMNKASVENGVVTIDNAARHGGEIFVFARHALGSGKGWMRVTYGFAITLDASNKESRKNPTVRFFTETRGEEFDGEDSFYVDSKIQYSSITDKAESSIESLEKRASKQLTQILTDVSLEKGALTPKQKTAVSHLLKSLAKKYSPEIE